MSVKVEVSHQKQAGKQIKKWIANKFRAINDNKEPRQEPDAGDFRPLVRGGGWSQLNSGIRVRFDEMATHPDLVEYVGRMEVDRSKIGWCFAQICRLFGTPLAPYKGHDVPVAVNVFPVENGGMCWQRIYNFENCGKITVQSIKIVDQHAGLLECVGGGLGMRLQVYEENGALHFKSRRYFLDILGIRLPVPLLLTPGEVHVSQIDEGHGYFRFRLIFNHPWFGETFYQDGLFLEKEALFKACEKEKAND